MKKQIVILIAVVLTFSAFGTVLANSDLGENIPNTAKLPHQCAAPFLASDDAQPLINDYLAQWYAAPYRDLSASSPDLDYMAQLYAGHYRSVASSELAVDYLALQYAASYAEIVEDTAVDSRAVTLVN